jgi:hypothetical protein
MITDFQRKNNREIEEGEKLAHGPCFLYKCVSVIVKSDFFFKNSLNCKILSTKVYLCVGVCVCEWGSHSIRIQCVWF